MPWYFTFSMSSKDSFSSGLGIDCVHRFCAVCGLKAFPLDVVLFTAGPRHVAPKRCSWGLVGW